MIFVMINIKTGHFNAKVNSNVEDILDRMEYEV